MYEYAVYIKSVGTILLLFNSVSNSRISVFSKAGEEVELKLEILLLSLWRKWSNLNKYLNNEFLGFLLCISYLYRRQVYVYTRL